MTSSPISLELERRRTGSPRVEPEVEQLSQSGVASEVVEGLRMRKGQQQISFSPLRSFLSRLGLGSVELRLGMEQEMDQKSLSLSRASRFSLFSF